MRLGIDFGTTHVVVAAADGNDFGVVQFHDAAGTPHPWYPSICAVRDGRFHSGHAARALISDPTWDVARSVKRLLSTAGPMTFVLGMPVRELLCRFFVELRRALETSSNLQIPRGERLEVAIAVPASANANQRLLTADAVTAAGFQVVRMLDEPSASGLEYALHRPDDVAVRRRHLAVYDLGGGTFDTAVIRMNENWHEVIASDGVQRLGGDDFDELLLQLAVNQLGKPLPAEGPQRDRMLEICRQTKESITIHTRVLKPQLFAGEKPPSIPVKEFGEAIRPLVDRTLAALQATLDEANSRAGTDFTRSTVVYQVGGASQLPVISRLLREQFKRRVWTSPSAQASVAIGLAIAACDAEHRVRTRFNRNFGVWREQDHGRAATFDPILTKDMLVPDSGSIVITRRYRAAHNVGHFRFLECSRLGQDGAPSGDVIPFNEIRFPLLGNLRDSALSGVDIVRLGRDEAEIEERYHCTSDGQIAIELVNLSEGYGQRFQLQTQAA